MPLDNDHENIATTPVLGDDKIDAKLNHLRKVAIFFLPLIKSFKMKLRCRHGAEWCLPYIYVALTALMMNYMALFYMFTLPPPAHSRSSSAIRATTNCGDRHLGTAFQFPYWIRYFYVFLLFSAQQPPRKPPAHSTRSYRFIRNPKHMEMEAQS